jgi:LmbE family N-acetylglucosaminyl deacetylase
MSERNLVFVVCHPDDEALWAGATIHGLSQLPGLRVHVICLSGADARSPREREFETARQIGGYAGGVVLGGPLRRANERLPDTAGTARAGLDALGLRPSDVALLVTHSPYGDEHLNPHHVQAYRELFAWTSDAAIPFGWFSVTAVPHLVHTPCLGAPRRAHCFEVIGAARCAPTLRTRITRLLRRDLSDLLAPPRWWLQFAGDLQTKTRMLNAYVSVGIEAHAAGYAAWTSACESLYVFDDHGLAALLPAIDTMQVPGETGLFTVLRQLRAPVAPFRN